MLRACSGGITSRLTLYASITDSRQKHAEWNAKEPAKEEDRMREARWSRGGSGEVRGRASVPASVAPRWKPRNQKIDSAMECDHPESDGGDGGRQSVNSGHLAAGGSEGVTGGGDRSGAAIAHLRGSTSSRAAAPRRGTSGSPAHSRTSGDGSRRSECRSGGAACL